MATTHDIRVSLPCSTDPVALAAAFHFDLSTPNFMAQETFLDFDAPCHVFPEGITIMEFKPDEFVFTQPVLIDCLSRMRRWS